MPLVTPISARVGFFGKSGRRAWVPASAGLSLREADLEIVVAGDGAHAHGDGAFQRIRFTATFGLSTCIVAGSGHRISAISRVPR